MVSVIIPTFNEHRNLGELIPHLLSCERSGQLEIIVCDATPRYILDPSHANHSNVKFIKSPKASRSFQLNFGASLASHDTLYFLHADTRPPSNFVSEILDSIEDGYHFGIFSYRFNSKNILLKINAFFTRFDGFFAGGGDQSLFITKSAYQDLGGYNTDMRIMEDFDFYKRAKKSEYMFTLIRDPLLVSARKYEQNSWLKVNFINFKIFFTYLLNGSEKEMIHLNKKLHSEQQIQEKYNS